MVDVEKTRVAIGDERTEACLALEKRLPADIVPIHPQKVEREKTRLAASGHERVELRAAVLIHTSKFHRRARRAPPVANSPPRPRGDRTRRNDAGFGRRGDTLRRPHTPALETRRTSARTPHSGSSKGTSREVKRSGVAPVSIVKSVPGHHVFTSSRLHISAFS